MSCMARTAVCYSQASEFSFKADQSSFFLAFLSNQEALNLQELQGRLLELI
ncbi:hypothetical protein Hdeb2414_s0687g00935831 [Helianthus debilis subsp. tardiflorus]